MPLMATAALLCGIYVQVFAQAPAGAAPATPPPTPKAAGPIDLTGYWVSVITEDWRFRMVTPARGDYASIPITPEALKIADQWNPAKDTAAGEQCKSYGAPALMRLPTRLHITWQDDNTLKVETDAGQQTRLLHFGEWKAPGGPATWQGDSVASWETPRPRGGRARAGTPPAPAKTGDLKVFTTHLRAGYLRKNGVPYSANAELTEYWDINTHHDGSKWIVVTSNVHDPMYLQEDWITALHFRKEPDGSKWDTTPCSATW